MSRLVVLAFIVISSLGLSSCKYIEYSHPQEMVTWLNENVENHPEIVWCGYKYSFVISNLVRTQKCKVKTENESIVFDCPFHGKGSVPFSSFKCTPRAETYSDITPFELEKWLYHNTRHQEHFFDCSQRAELADRNLIAQGCETRIVVDRLNLKSTHAWVAYDCPKYGKGEILRD